MKDYDIGKRLYRSSALIQFKLIFMLIAFWVLVNLYLKTFSDPDFMVKEGKTFIDVLLFHKMYPTQIIGYFIGTFCPSVYYAFFRSITFFEKGFVINKGIPFVNQSIKYENILSFKIIHPKYLMSIKRKDVGEEVLFTIGSIDRVIAIFDQQGIEGNLGKSPSIGTFSANKKMIIAFIICGVILSILQYTGIIIDINRYFFR